VYNWTQGQQGINDKFALADKIILHILQKAKFKYLSKIKFMFETKLGHESGEQLGSFGGKKTKPRGKRSHAIVSLEIVKLGSIFCAFYLISTYLESDLDQKVLLRSWI
jgi:hypothetical protein